MFSMWRNLMVNGPQTGIAIGQNCDRSGFIDSALPQRKTDRAHRLGTSVAHESKACGMPIAIQRLASKDFKVSEPCKELVVGFDGGYVRNRHQRPERSAEVLAAATSKVLKPPTHIHRPVEHGAGSCLCRQRKKLAHEPKEDLGFVLSLSALPDIAAIRLMLNRLTQP
ncbi:hypothetical protein [Tunturiibacter gelidiferens]|uniref:hypothetical protein n=1 Tax=Tunturiibacter gelidiferens TaxID=3069689 RepID=UPI003D9B3FDE